MADLFDMEEDKTMVSEDAFSERMEDSLLSITGDDWYKCHRVNVRCEPVVEVLSVSLRNNNMCSSKGSWEIFGKIYVYDITSHNRCDIYDRDEEYDEPEIIPLDVGGTLSLTGPDDIMSMERPMIGFDIRDKVTGETIICESAPLLKTVDTAKQQNHPFEQFKKIIVHGTSCSAEVEYLALTFAVFAPVEVRLFKQQVEGSGNNKLQEDKLEKQDQLEVYGTVSASYNLYYSESKFNRIMLYEITEDSNDSELVTLGSPITLSRSVVAVPAYSSLTIQVELWNRATKMLIVQGSYKVETCNELDHEVITGLNCVNAEVTVDWEEPFLLSRPAAKKDEIHWGIHFHFWAPHAVEVFSIFIGRQNDEQLSLYGMVTFDGFRGRKCLFKRDKNDPYVLPPGSNLLPLKGPDDTLIPADTFMMSVDLEDVDGCVSIKGFVPSSYELDKHKKAWFNRLLCGVVKGGHEHSFAAIHYTVLSYVLKATLKVHFFFKGKPSSDDFSKIHGSLVALYDKYGCKTPYEKLYYRNVLFERLEDNPLELPCMNFDVDLSRHVVAVPYNCSLQIEIDLSCQSTSFIERLKETKRFQISPGVCDDVIIEGAEVGININVEWRQA